MTKFNLLMGVAAIGLAATPALAEKSDRVFLTEMQNKIAAARAEPGVPEHGSAELQQADAAMLHLAKDLDDNEARRTESDVRRINALIDAARVRAKVASLKTEVAELKLQTDRAKDAQVADAQAAAASAQADAANAQADAAKARAEADRVRSEMAEYQLKQTQLGATLVLQDVVFETGKADLKPGAAERLRPLATYLQANPAVRVQIDGHTDAQGSDAMNQTLSDRRAGAVRAALASMGVDPTRVQAIGHGKTQPVADNNTQAGRQQNRRVEVTLVGQQAQSFAGR